MTARRNDLVRLTFLGDTLVGGEAQPLLDEKGPRWVFDDIRHLFASSDMVVVNHEGPITRRSEPGRKLDTGRKRYWYRALPESVEALVDIGVQVVSLANNHVLDFGADGLFDTIRALDDAGIAHCGAAPTRAEARRPAIREVKGLAVAFLSFMQRYHLYVEEELYASRTRAGPLRLDLRRARVDLARLDGKVDLRIALVHWGRNYRKLNRRQRRLAEELRVAGADVIVGHHPHIPQRVEIHDGAPICYSLGNGPLGTPGRFHSGRPPYGLIVSLDFDERAVLRRIAVEMILVDNAQVSFRPRVADGVEARRLLRKLLPRELDWQEGTGDGLVAEPVERPGVAHTVGTSRADGNVYPQ